MRGDGEIVLVSCYELGHQPLALASPLAFLRQQGFAPTCLDLSVDHLDEAAASALARARLVAISVPMHTALRLGVRVAGRVRALNPGAHICFYGLYAPLNARYLLSSGADSVRGGEYEVALVELAQALAEGRRPPAAATELRRLPFIVPQRDPLPPLRRYAHLVSQGQERLAGYVEATRGCRHLCRHCPIPAVYGGASSRSRSMWCWPTPASRSQPGRDTSPSATPTSSMAPRHALAVARGLHQEHPEVTFDATIKVEHILQQRDLFPELARLGCLFVVSAVESLSDDVLAILDKGHRQQDAVQALQIVRDAGMSLRPTFVPFTPWTTREGYLQLCRFIDEYDLEDEVDPIQLALRLLIPPGSLLLDRAELRPFLGEVDEAALTYRWQHPNPQMDRLQEQVSDLVDQASRRKEDPAVTFGNIHEMAGAASGDRRRSGPPAIKGDARRRRLVAPRLSEPWFCCAEPSRSQREQVSAPAAMPSQGDT